MHSIQCSLSTNVVATLVLNAMYLTGLLTQPSQGTWSEELGKRLTKHSCKPGNVQKDTTLLHKLKSGTFTELGHVKDLEVCVLQCCESRQCELALLKNNFCYGITCYSPQHCKTVPAYEGDDMVVVFVTKAKTNITKHGTQTSQSRSNQPTKNSEQFVFYPVDSSSSTDLAFSVNLRNIAKHYVQDENVRNVLTAKADEHLSTGANKNIYKNGENRNSSKLDEFLSKSQGHSSQDDHTAPSGKRSETIPKPTKQKPTKSIEWGPKLLKAAISSSSVALLIVLLVLLAMTRKKRT